MGAFDDISLFWKGKELKIRANRVLGAIARIEDVVTFNELQNIGARGGVPTGKISQAYGAVLRYVGQDVDDEEVYLEMFNGVGARGDEMVKSISTLVAMMVPKTPTRVSKEAPRGNAHPTGTALSRGRTKSRSGKEN